LAQGTFNYHPAQRIEVTLGGVPSLAIIPETFAGSVGLWHITITGTTVIQSGNNIEVKNLQSGATNSFAPVVDPATNVIYGAAGTELVTISLCNYRAATLPN
jgi:hypothetical protein